MWTFVRIPYILGYDVFLATEEDLPTLAEMLEGAGEVP